MIDPAEKQAMANILRAMGNFDPEALAAEAASAPPAQRQINESVVAPPAMMASPEASAMKNILTAFYQATDEATATVSQSVERLTESAQTFPELRAAMATAPTAQGARIGEWNIIVKESGKRKSYDVADIASGTIIASELSLYEAARALANSLNEGLAINSAPVKKIMAAEEDYSRNLEDAIRYRHSGRLAEGKGDSRRHSILEARYDDAKLRALQAKAIIEAML